MRNIEPLSNREIECLYQAALDKNARETAETLCISTETVRTHHSVILRKLRCKTITGAVMMAVNQGLILDNNIKSF